MKVIDLLKKLKAIEKPFFSMADLEKITGYRKASLKVALGRLVKNKFIIRISRGAYTLPENLDKLPQMANQLYDPSYLSFESALSRHGILSQIPYTLTFATTNRSKKITMADTNVEYRQIKTRFFTGFSKKDNLLIAYPEKALLDQLYMVSRGRANLSFEELDLKPINKARFIKLSHLFPQYTQKLAKDLIKKFGRMSITVR